MLDLKSFEKFHVFILECLLGMMLFLVQDIFVYRFNVRMTV